MSLILFEPQVVDFISRRITTQEAEQIIDWSMTELQTKINKSRVNVKHLLQIVAHQTMNSLRFLLHDSPKQFADEQPPFVQYYHALLQANIADDDKEKKAAAKTKWLKKLRERGEHRNEILTNVFQDYDSKTFRFLQIATWFEQQQLQKQDEEKEEQQTSLQFNLIVDAFIEYMVERLLAVSINRFIFPKIE